MEPSNDDLVVPVVREELHADAVPVQTGSVRVSKHIEGHDEILEQELRRGRVEVKRVKTEREVDGPQPVQHVGNKLIIPVVSEVLHVEKRWVVTEEIHLTQVEERESVQQKVRVNREEARVERLDESGKVISETHPELEAPESSPGLERETRSVSEGLEAPESLVARKSVQSTSESPASKRKVLSRPQSILKSRP